MTEQTTASILVAAPPAAVLAVVADFAAYPDWVSAVKETEVVGLGPGGLPSRVRFVLDAGLLKDEYTLAYTWGGERGVSWELVSATVLTALDGSYRLVPRGSVGTEVVYRLSVGLALPLLAQLRQRAERAIVRTALAELKARVEGGAGG